MEKRTFLAIGISILILIIFQYVMPTPKPVPPDVEQSAVTQDADSKEAPVSAGRSTVPFKDNAQRPDYSKKQEDKTLKPITVKTDLYTLTISNKGAVITGLELNRYKDKFNGDGKFVQLISEHSKKQNFYPLTLIYDQQELTQRINDAFYDATTYDLLLSQDKPEGKLELFYTDPEGIKVTKELHFTNDNYHISVNIRQQNLSDYFIPARYYLAWGYDLGREQEASRYHYVGPTSYVDGELINDKPSSGFSCSAPKEVKDFRGFHKGNISWTALQDVYFASILIPGTPTSEVMITTENGNSMIAVGSGDNQLAPGTEGSDSFEIYAGPKKLDKLKVLDRELDKIIDYGWFDVLAKPLMQVLEFSHTFTTNYGWDIVILTILIKLVFYPLTTAGFKSMRKMQTVQPKIANLRKKYKDNPQKLNQEVMELYKKHKVNPLGGCLPMILQIPVFFALYKALLMSIELRHAPFVPFDTVPFTKIIWLADLSAKDPYYVTPILMGISMFVQQKMTPSTGDPKQAKMMLLMPVIFTFMFLNFPSGLVVYWLLNNVLGIGQQYLINKQEQAKEEAAA